MPELEPRILIVYASQSGKAQQLAAAVERGAQAEGATVRKLHGTLAGLDDLLWCGALAIVTPENFGYMAGAVKDFFDRTFYPAEGKVTHLPYGVVVRAGNDGSFALAAVERIARGFPLRRVAEPILWVGDSEAPIGACEELGQLLAAGLALGVLGGPTR